MCSVPFLAALITRAAPSHHSLRSRLRQAQQTMADCSVGNGPTDIDMPDRLLQLCLAAVLLFVSAVCVKALFFI
jgi:hypothetical protein